MARSSTALKRRLPVRFVKRNVAGREPVGRFFVALLAQNPFHNVRFLHSGQLHVETLMFHGQAIVIDS